MLVGKPEWKRPLERPRHRWEDNIRIDLREIGWEGVNWINLAQDWDQWRAVVNTVVSFGVHKRQGISRLADRLSASQEGLCSTHLLKGI
jgi:hypothetical protein